MVSFGSDAGNVLYLVVCAVPGAEQTLARVKVEQEKGWDVCVIATERAFHWFDSVEVERVTGHPIQSRMRRYGESLFEPLGDAVLMAPGSFNTINKIAIGLADDMASGLVCEALGRQIPITIEPQLGEAFALHPAFAGHIQLLADAGVTFVWRDPTVAEIVGTS